MCGGDGVEEEAEGVDHGWEACGYVAAHERRGKWRAGADRSIAPHNSVCQDKDNITKLVVALHTEEVNAVGGNCIVHGLFLFCNMLLYCLVSILCSPDTWHQFSFLSKPHIHKHKHHAYLESNVDSGH